MVPAVVAADIPSAAERRLFARLKAELGPDWTVLHSLGLTVHQRKPWAEIDFVLVGPPGIICLEVKGGRIKREGGLWVFTDRHGNEHKKAEGPFEQVGSASAALRHFLLANDRRYGSTLVAYAVCTPDVTFAVTGPDIDPELVYDARDTSRPFGEFLARVARRWHGRLGRTTPLIDDATRVRLRTLLRPDFDARPALLSVITSAEGDMIQLTDQQVTTFESLIANERVLVEGSAGTGKSVLAALEADRLASEGRRVLLTCFGRRLARHLELQVGDGVEVVNLHALMARIVKAAGLAERVPDASSTDLMRVFYPELCVEALLEDSGPPFDAIVVDEGQDLLTEANLDVLDALLVGGLRDGIWRVFLDPMQNIFDGTGRDELETLKAHRPTSQWLTLNCRNTAQIASTTAIITELDVAQTLAADGPDVEIIWCRDAPDQLRHLGRVIGRLRSGGLQLMDIVVLGPRTLDRSALHARKVPGLDCRIGELDAPDVLRYSTIADFKGLESRAIVLLDIDSLDAPEMRSLLYVATSRPRAWLTILMAEPCGEQFALRAERFGARLAQTVPSAEAT